MKRRSGRIRVGRRSDQQGAVASARPFRADVLEGTKKATPKGGIVRRVVQRLFQAINCLRLLARQDRYGRTGTAGQARQYRHDEQRKASR